MNPPLLELTRVGRWFLTGDQETHVLKGIDLAIHEGEMVAVIGASGSGKSTLMNILGCLDHPSEGSYRINGRETAALDPDALARLRREHFGFVFQRYHLLPHLDAIRNTEIPAVYAGMDKAGRRARAEAMLTRLGLDERLDYRPGQLSGGQQQRVSIARALMNGGKVILADEPTGALDSKSSDDMLAILRELHGRGHTVVIVTHDMQVADHAGRIVTIRDGEIIRDQPNPMAAAGAADPDEKTQETDPAVSEDPVEASPATGFRAEWGRFAEALKTALAAMAAHRLRTLLTMLGIVIGIASVVSVVALGQGARQKVISDISAMGTNVIGIYPGTDWGDVKSGSIHTLVPSDLSALSAQTYVDSVTPGTRSSLLLRYRNRKADATVNGVGAQYFRVRGFTIASGAAFDGEDIRNRAQVAVIDPNTAKKLFPRESPVGRIVFVGDLPCRVIGVTRKKESPFGNNQNLNVWLPYTAAMARIFGTHYFGSITVRVRDGVPNAAAQQSIIRLLKERHGRKDFYTDSSDTVLKTVEKTTATMTLLISAIAVISLVVGGIGVMNIMLVSVSERTHEIGIRMAVGARQSDILRQFLIEAVLVCLSGGLLGVLLSYGIGLIFPLFVQTIAMRFSAFSIIAAFLCASLIGVIFGYLPAQNAARLDPIEALARE